MKVYKPRNHGENRMNHEGNILLARKIYFEQNNNNLSVLLRNRFSWMNDFITGDDIGIEVGCGTGIAKNYICSDNFYLTDYTDYDFLDYKMVDALDTKFPNDSFDFVLSNNMIHHVPYPITFFEEMNRILKPKGKLIIQEINCSFFMQLLLRLMRHEGFDFTIDVFDENLICTDPEDLWSANCAIPNLLFDDKDFFQGKFPYFKIIHSPHSEFFNFINSGGVISKTFYIPLPKFVLDIVTEIDNKLSIWFPNIFALQRQIVLEKK